MKLIANSNIIWCDKNKLQFLPKSWDISFYRESYVLWACTSPKLDNVYYTLHQPSPLLSFFLFSPNCRWSSMKVSLFSLFLYNAMYCWTKWYAVPDTWLFNPAYSTLIENNITVFILQPNTPVNLRTIIESTIELWDEIREKRLLNIQSSSVVPLELSHNIITVFNVDSVAWTYVVLQMWYK